MHTRPTLLVSLLVALLAAPTPTLAEPSADVRLACPENDPRLEARDLNGAGDCGNAANQREINECLGQRRFQSEISLRKSLDHLLATLDAPDRDRFRRAHAAWCAYRDAACDFDAPSDAMGSMLPGLRQQCRAARNMAKEKAVLTLSNCIAHGGCENPLLFFIYEVRPGVH